MIFSLFASWVTSFQQPELLVALESKRNAHLMVVVSVYTSIVHDDCLSRSIHDLFLSVVLFFFTVIVIHYQPSCKFLKLFNATEVLQILYNSVSVL